MAKLGDIDARNSTREQMSMNRINDLLSMIDLAPTFDLVAVEPLDAPQQSEVIIRPDNAEMPGYGRVLASGPGGWQGEKQIATGLRPGDMVYYNAKNANTVWVRAKKLVFVRAANVYAKEVPPPKFSAGQMVRFVANGTAYRAEIEAILGVCGADRLYKYNAVGPFPGKPTVVLESELLPDEPPWTPPA